MTTHGLQIRAARERQGISLRRLAQRTGISAGHLSLIETGQRPLPKPETLARICSELGIDYPAVTQPAQDAENQRLRAKIGHLHGVVARLRAAFAAAERDMDALP